MKKIFLGSIIALLVLAVSVFIINSNNSPNTPELILGNSTTSEGTVISSVQGNGTSESVQMGSSALALHNSASDCWVVYKNKVYDITNFIPQHSGGEGPIAKTCGTTNFESAFQRQHGTSKANMFMKVTTYKGDFAV